MLLGLKKVHLKENPQQSVYGVTMQLTKDSLIFGLHTGLFRL